MPDISTPHISKDWREDFIIAMRTQDASGEQIGDALATVDAHCAESGESAEEAFGDPTTYATTLVPGPAAGSGFGASFLVGVLMGLLGLLIVPRAVDDWVTRTPFTVTIGDVVALAVVLGLTSVVMALPRRVLPWLAKVKYSVAGLLGVALMAVLVLAMLFLTDVVAEFSWLVALVIGVGLLVASVTSTWRDLSTPDPVADPRSTEAPPRRTQWLAALTFPILTVLILGIDALFRLAS